MPLTPLLVNVRVSSPHYVRFPMEDRGRQITVHTETALLHRSPALIPFRLLSQFDNPFDCHLHISPASDRDLQLGSVSANYGVRSIHSKGNL